MSIHRAAVLAVAAIGGVAGHYVGDYLVQRDHDAVHKQDHVTAWDDIAHGPLTTEEHLALVWSGWRALATHAVSYGATQATLRALLYRVAGLRVPVGAQLATVVLETALHAAIDDGRALRRFSDVTGKRAFHDLAAGGVNGRALMDQAAHLGLQIPLGAAATAILAGAAVKRAS